MKIKSYITLGLAIVITASLTSCKKDFYTDVNVNPNAPDSVPPNTQLSTIEGALAYSQGGDMSRFTSLFMQQTFSEERQAGAYYQYILTSQDIDGLWTNLYTSTMGNCKDMIANCDRNQYNAFGGVGRILMAYTLQITIDCYGDIPYAQAFQGTINTQPTYDNATGLYTTIAQLIDEAISKLNNDTVPGNIIPGSEDVIYGGDVTKWIKLGHAIKARLALHQSKGNAAKAQEALNEIAQSFTSQSDGAQYIFSTAETAANPWYQFNDQRGDIQYSTSTLASSMIANADPRSPVLFDTTSNPDDANPYLLGDYYGAINGHVDFITYDELLFMKAEATLRATGNIVDAQTAYVEAITANMTRLGVSPADIATYIAANGILPIIVDDAIAAVANESYIALYLNPEAWITWRRTGFPSLTPVTGNLGIPRRFLYPQTEYTYNGANVPASTLYTPKLFWDN